MKKIFFVSFLLALESCGSHELSIKDKVQNHCKGLEMEYITEWERLCNDSINNETILAEIRSGALASSGDSRIINLCCDCRGKEHESETRELFREFGLLQSDLFLIVSISKDSLSDHNREKAQGIIEKMKVIIEKVNKFPLQN